MQQKTRRRHSAWASAASFSSMTATVVTSRWAANTAHLKKQVMLTYAFIVDEHGSTLDSARDYIIEENVTALCGMTRLDFDTWRVVLGLLWVQTVFLVIIPNLTL